MHLQDKLGYELKLNHIGYLWLFSEDQCNLLRTVLNRMRRHGIELRNIDSEVLGRAIPDLVTKFTGDEEAEIMGIKPIDVGFFAPKCGSVDADSVCRAYETEFLKLGGVIKFNTEAKRLLVKPREEMGIPGEPFIWQEKIVAGAETNKGIISAEKTIVATGAWSESILNPIGLDPMMRPKKSS
jgi:glycine/D-amino acid oxidase-like deaminating enzyme